MRVRIGLVSALLLGLTSPLALFRAPAEAASAAAASTASTARSVARPVLTSSAKQVVEGARLTLAATVKSPKTATRVTLQKWSVPLYSTTASWQTLKTVTVNRRSKVPFKIVATDLNTERYRVTVAYRTATRPVASNSVNITVWRWIPLSDYAPYYQSESYVMFFGTTVIAGHAYSGWGPADYSHTGTWEARFTPGRHCKAFKAVLGLADISADGSSGSITFTADDTQIYASPSLTPGMSVPATVDLTTPYRFGIQLYDTTPSGTTGHDAVESWPELGEPAFLCTGV